MEDPIQPKRITPSPEKQKIVTNPYLKYSGMAFQMIATILLGALGGIQLDKYLGTVWIFTTFLLLCAVIIAMYNVIRDFV